MKFLSDTRTHEAFRERDALKTSSDRSFGIVFAIVFVAIGLFPLLDSNAPRWWSIGLSAAFLFAAFVYPKILAPLNNIWMKFGLLLHRVVNPIILGVLFFLVITPIALLMRALGKRPLKLKSEPDAQTYWISRDPPGPEPDTMKQQF